MTSAGAKTVRIANADGSSFYDGNRKEWVRSNGGTRYKSFEHASAQAALAGLVSFRLVAHG
jgi:hypothetical protein